MAVITLDKIIFRNNDSYLKMYKGSELIAEVGSTPALDYLTFTNIGSNSVTVNFSRTNQTAYYSSDGGTTWNTLGSSTSQRATIPVNGSIKLKCTISSAPSSSQASSSPFTFGGTNPRIRVTGNIMSMHSGDNYKTAKAVLYNYAFGNYFNQQTAIIEVGDILRDIETVRASNVFMQMFYGCANLTTPATTLNCSIVGERNCYNMYNGCTSLTTTTDITRSRLDTTSSIYSSAFYGMYRGCTSLTSIVGKLPSVLGYYTYSYSTMFYGCTSLTSIPADYFSQQTSTNIYSMDSMFYGCTSLTSLPNGLFSTITEFKQLTCQNMFRDCTGLTTVGNIFKDGAELQSTSSLVRMFAGCTSLTSATIAKLMLKGSSSLNYMFQGCTSLNNVYCYMIPSIGSSSQFTSWLANVAATGTFHCANDSTWTLNSSSGIPSGWTKVEEYKESEFYIQPKSSVTLTDDSLLSSYIWDNYANYYYKRENLDDNWVQFPDPVPQTTTLADWMASHPTCLVGLVPSTSTTSINFFSWNDSTSRYDSWPGMPATLLGISGNYKVYYRDINVNVDGNMIICNSAGSSQTDNITNVATIYSGGNVPYWSESGKSVSNVAISSISFTTSMEIVINDRMYLRGDIDDTAPSVNFAFNLGNNVDFTVGGDVRSIIVADDYGTAATRPTGLSTANEVNCIVENEDISSTYIRDYYDDQYFKVYVYPKPQPLTFTALEAGSTVKFNRTGVTSEYSTDNGSTWTSGDNVTVTLSNVGDKVRYRGVTSTTSSSVTAAAFNLTGQIKASGSVNSMINNNPEDTSLNNKINAFRKYFSNQSALKDISELILPATTLTDSCYINMFDGCTNLTTIPTLPATTLAAGCYRGMFSGCTGLTTIPENLLPVTTLATECYFNMFRGTGISTIPSGFLPATTLIKQCYRQMFRECANLTTIPEDLFANVTEVKDSSCQGMFNQCTSLTNCANFYDVTYSGSSSTAYPFKAMYYGCTNANTVKSYVTNWDSTTIFNSWADGVASTGDFYNLGGATISSGTINGIPTGWTEHTSL